MTLSNQRKKHRARRYSKHLSLIEAAAIYAHQAYEGERLKYAPEGPYYWHPKSVSRAMHTIDEKVVALLHDVIELVVKKKLGKNPDPVAEEELIQKTLKDIQNYFNIAGHDVSRLLPHLDDLTRRRSMSYKAYMQKMIDNAKARALVMPEQQAFIAIKVKKADLRHNRDDKRNQPEWRQTEADEIRLRRYDTFIQTLDEEFPTVELRYDPRDEQLQRGKMIAKRQGVNTDPDANKKKKKGAGRPPPREARVAQWERDMV